MAVVRCPSLPAAINTEKGEEKEGGDDFFEKERNKEGGKNFGEREKGSDREESRQKRGEEETLKNRNRGEQSTRKKTQRRRRKVDHHPSRSPSSLSSPLEAAPPTTSCHRPPRHW